MDPAIPQSYLNWFAHLFCVHQAEGKWPKNARAVRHLLMAGTTSHT